MNIQRGTYILLRTDGSVTIIQFAPTMHRIQHLLRADALAAYNDFAAKATSQIDDDRRGFVK